MEDREVESIARFLGISSSAFLGRFCEKKNSRFYVRTGPDGYCAFYEKEKRCLIHPVKPRPCRLWPFYPALLRDRDNWEMAKEACPGINPKCPFEEFLAQAEE